MEEKQITYKQCTKCENFYPMTEDYFYRSKYSKSGFLSWCKECVRNKSNKYYHEHRDEYLTLQKEWYRNNRDRKIRESQKWNKQNIKRLKENSKKWRQQNKDKIKIYNKYRKMNKEHEITDNEWEACKMYFNYSCAYCGMTEEKAKEKYGNSLHKEHVDHNGSNKIDNCVPACKSCNSKKRTKTLYEFAQQENIEEWRIRKIEKWLQEDYLKYKE